jgi:hypothetical protein
MDEKEVEKYCSCMKSCLRALLFWLRLFVFVS